MRNKVIVLALITILLTSCGSIKKGISFADLIPLDKITTPEKAQQALVISQDFRMASLRSVKKAVQLGILPVSYMDNAREIDNRFRPLWASLESIVTDWSTQGSVSENTFRQKYRELYIESSNLNELKKEADAKIH